MDNDHVIQKMYALVEAHICDECDEFKHNCTCEETDAWKRHLEDDPGRGAR